MSNHGSQPMVVYHLTLPCVCKSSTHQIRSRWGSVAWLGLVVSFGWTHLLGTPVCPPVPATIRSASLNAGSFSLSCLLFFFLCSSAVHSVTLVSLGHPDLAMSRLLILIVNSLEL
ncbi:uncharacterized protein B0J16DRAFT_347075 [Fusarium flagelliforme]|uniref:uncharacterized protein n=1 Tax=Fusarium flagelliforme TaxID=2675880 RepID=UPI001E8E96C1|nr:uncharacterized protein B0J16DRAFT_347075 [Fusarium flagelliforme]KAH7179500.1 hypothetical protein B0J16DRAFT_347075 [Fusarium flagelliforme]